MRPERVLFVCTGNICRSPMAMGLARKHADSTGLDLAFSSAGVMTRNGLPASEHAVGVMGEQAIDIGAHRSRLLSAGILKEADLVVAMEEEHRLAIREFPESAMVRIPLLSEWGGEEAPGPGIDDPIGGSRKDYRKSAKTIESYIVRALESLRGGQSSD
jgi:protein-tyrosine-phosphatase